MIHRIVVVLSWGMILVSSVGSMTNDTASIRSCHNSGKHPTKRMAYAMSVLSTLAYCLPLDTKSFRVVKVRSIHRWSRLMCQGKQWVKRCWMYAVTRQKTPSQACPKLVRKKVSAKFELLYWFKDWREPTIIPGVRYHDTDLLVAKRRNDVILIFSGSASPTDHATNIQTFEKASHAGVFPGNGSLHRGFLNAYSRVNHGLVYSFATNTTNQRDMLQQVFGICSTDQPDMTRKEMNNATIHGMNIMIRRKKRGGCRVSRVRLRPLLLCIVQTALRSGKRVHIAGHSLGA